MRRINESQAKQVALAAVEQTFQQFGGTGKTFTYNYIIKEIIARNMSVAICVWTGIAATLLQDRGIFRQTFPIVKRARPAQVVEVCLKSSVIWRTLQIFHLRTNKSAGLQEEAFANWLLELGDGRLPVKRDDTLQRCIEMPLECVLQRNEDHIQAIFDDAAAADFRRRVILTPTNDEALEINDLILETLPGEMLTHFSIDSFVLDNPKDIPKKWIVKWHKISCLPHVLNCEVLTGIAASCRVLIPRIALAPNDTNLKLQVKRVQFPLRLSYALTINKN
ncbi:uncharacterized protein LOC130636965 [Hydractinia symbiolongicarpus]|uniref:uncharacterized protein LOC130636965 n=1 Tax=Hydractinia symbiolongicarpus TaxID=13093 RepID=UPI00254C6B15|nr:uncharacterized protein LOC130636965 [Hydractinia symbiolongicarpus]